jgi:predicted secreted protein
MFFYDLDAVATKKYAGGTGEPNDPYQIATAEDLMQLGDSPEDYDKHFILTADIDLDPNLPGRKVFDKAVIAPDTDPTDLYSEFQGTPFTGVFDGNSHTISHLTIMGSGYLGLLGQLGHGAEVKKLGVVDVNITGSGDYVGGLVGYNQGNVIQCYSSGTVNARGYVGGLVGVNWGNVAKCHSSVTVWGQDNVGGLAGHNVGFPTRGVLSDCWSTGAVHGREDVGGLVGSNYGSIRSSHSSGSVSGTHTVGGLVGVNPREVANCYSTSTVVGDDSVGGLVGANWTWRPMAGLVTKCYSTGMVVGGKWRVGGLVGSNKFSHSDFGTIEGVVSASFWDTETSGRVTSDGGTGKTTGEMQTAKTFLDAGWDFVGETTNGTEDIWKIAEGLDYPRLWWEPYDGRVTVVLGQIFTVALESNPSTGYRWEWVDDQDSIVEQMGEAQFTPRETGDPPLVGAGGWESFDFKAVHPGQMTLQLVYRRPWEEAVEPLKTFSLQVTVP